MPEQREGRNPLERFVITVKNVFETPVEWFRGMKEAPNSISLFALFHPIWKTIVNILLEIV